MGATLKWVAIWSILALVGTGVAMLIIDPPAELKALFESDEKEPPKKAPESKAASMTLPAAPVPKPTPKTEEPKKPIEYKPLSELIGDKQPEEKAETKKPVNFSEFVDRTKPYEERVEPGELIVTNPPEGFEEKLGAINFKIIERKQLEALGSVILRLETPSDMPVPKALQLLKSRFPGITADANHQYDPSSGEGPLRLHARSIMGWPLASATCGKGLKLGMIDSGVDMSHPALYGQDIVARAFPKPGRKAGPAVHGTAIAAILSGVPKWGGLLPGAKLYAANMFEFNEQGKKVGSAYALMQSINWMAEVGVDVVNMSVAGSDNKVLQKIFARALQTGIIFVAAAGNEGEGAKPAYPAAYNFVLAVTAIKTDKTVYEHANRGDYIDFAAPGVQLWTAVPGGGKFQSGTSFASPYVTAMLAQQIQRYGRKDPETLRKILLAYTVDLGATGKDSVFGYGLAGLMPDCR